MSHSPGLHALWVSVFGLEAVVKSEQLSHLLGGLALALQLAVHVVTEHRAQG